METITNSAPSATATAIRKANNKCQHHTGECLEKIVKIVGECRYCNGKFCAKHRLPEAHSCSNLKTCKDEALGKLTQKVLGEKTVAQKV